MLSLREVVERYRAAAPDFGAPVALSVFALSKEETEKLFDGLDEDYHISRFLHFSDGQGTRYWVSGSEVTHVAIDGEIQSLL